MSKPTSDATLLRAAKREIKELHLLLNAARRLRDEYRERASKAEQECAEWKARFDPLLKRTPQEQLYGQYGQPSPSSADPLPKLPTSICKPGTLPPSDWSE
jgi:hypothetical protein